MTQFLSCHLTQCPGKEGRVHKNQALLWRRLQASNLIEVKLVKWENIASHPFKYWDIALNQQ
jgi:hypothetical protein